MSKDYMDNSISFVIKANQIKNLIEYANLESDAEEWEIIETLEILLDELPIIFKEEK